MKLTALVLLLAALAISGCATMTPEECAVADWERIGEADARFGLGMDHFARRSSDCAEAGYSADQQAWTRGWDQGITWFCTSNNGFRQGIGGHRYNRVCPGQLESEFLYGYETGYAIHEVQAQVDRTLADLDREKKRLEQLHDERPRDHEAIAETRERLAVLRDRLRRHELELARLRGVAQGQGFPVRN